MKKMKPYLLFLLLFAFASAGIVQGQSVKWMKKQNSYRNYSHIKNKQQIGFGGAWNQNGYDVNIFFGKYLRKDWLFRTDFMYENVNIDMTNMKLYYVAPELNYTILKIGNQCFIDLKVGVIAGREGLTNEIMVNKKINQIVFGEKVGIKIEYFISSDLSLNIDLEQRIFNNSKLGLASELALISLSYNF